MGVGGGIVCAVIGIALTALGVFSLNVAGRTLLETAGLSGNTVRFTVISCVRLVGDGSGVLMGLLCLIGLGLGVAAAGGHRVGVAQVGRDRSPATVGAGRRGGLSSTGSSSHKLVSGSGASSSTGSAVTASTLPRATSPSPPAP
jgi:hypothetical protein